MKPQQPPKVPGRRCYAADQPGGQAPSEVAGQLQQYGDPRGEQAGQQEQDLGQYRVGNHQQEAFARIHPLQDPGPVDQGEKRDEVDHQTEDKAAQ